MKKTPPSPTAMLRRAHRDVMMGVTEGAGEGEGLMVWCVESQKVTSLPAPAHGFMHQGCVYLVMCTMADDTTHLHIWRGSQASKADAAMAMSCAEELEGGMEGDGAAMVTVETEGHESSAFLRHFEDGLIICEGRTKQLLSRACKYTKRLYVLRGRKYTVADCTPPSPTHATPEAALLLDGHPRMYVWLGDRVDHVRRAKAINLAKKIRETQRDGKGHIVVIDKNEKHLNDSFLRKLQSFGVSERGKEEEAKEAEEGAESEVTSQLFRLTGDRVMYDMPLAAHDTLDQKFLNSQDSFLLDCGPSLPLYAWVGSRVDPDDRRRALHRAMVFSQHHGYPACTTVCRVLEGEEPGAFKARFSHWRDKTPKDRQLVRSYSIANIGRVLFSRSSRRTVAKLEELWSDDHFITGAGSTDMWQVQGDVPPVVQSPEGVFYNNSCYILRHQEPGVQVIYIWLGSKSSPGDQSRAQQLAGDMDDTLGHGTSLVRVLDGREPRHFLSILHRSMIVFDLDLLSGVHPPQPETPSQHGHTQHTHNTPEVTITVTAPEEALEDSGVCDVRDTSLEGEEALGEADTSLEGGRWAYCVREVGPETMRVIQVPPRASSLNSSAAFIVITDTDDMACIWYGKNATAYEREYSKSILAYLSPTKSFEYDIVSEGKEPSTFWNLVTKDGEYPKEYPKQTLERRVPCLAICKQHGDSWIFEDIPDFSQEDLSETDALILDTYDQVHLWCGRAVDGRDHSLYDAILQTYVSRDPAHRPDSSLGLWVVHQGSEPSTFCKFFPGWTDQGCGGVASYMAARKCLRQENARIDPDCQMVDLGHVAMVKVPYRQLVKEENLPGDVMLDMKEFHLSDKDFTQILRTPRAQFYRLPAWKQAQMLTSARLRTADNSQGSHTSQSPSYSIS